MRHIALQKQSVCVLWDMTFDTSACARRNFSRLFLSPVGLGQSTVWYDWWTEEAKRTWRRLSGIGRKQACCLIEWSLERTVLLYFLISLYRNRTKKISPQRAQVKNCPPSTVYGNFCWFVNWTDGNLSLVMAVAGSSTGSSRGAFFVVFFLH